MVAVLFSCLLLIVYFFHFAPVVPGGDFAEFRLLGRLFAAYVAMIVVGSLLNDTRYVNSGVRSLFCVSGEKGKNMAKKKNTPTYAKVVGGNLFVRTVPDMRIGRSGILDNGTRVEVLKVKGDWAETPAGFVPKEFLEFETDEE